MEYYIQTRGEEADYCWVTPISSLDAGQHKSAPPDLVEQYSQVLSGTHFSLVLKWLPTDRLLLVVKNLPSPRQDFRQRSIRNTLVCIASANQERLMRGITAAALEGQLEQVLNQVIQADHSDPLGFRVDFSSLQAQLNFFEATESGGNSLPRYYAQDLQSFRHNLAGDLLSYSLPAASHGFEPLILLSRNIEATEFETSRVWRGLSERIAAPTTVELPPLEPPGSPVSSLFLSVLLVLTILGAFVFLLITVFGFSFSFNSR